jgi:protein SCO1
MRSLFRIAACCAALVGAVACGRAGTSAPAPEPAAAAAPAPSDFSVYELGSSWTDQVGRSRQLPSLRGKIQVVAMVYTTCTHTCPSILAEMKRLEAGLGSQARDRVGFVFVSLDPEKDTPEQLASYATSARLDGERWTLLTGTEEDVRELAALLGIRYRDEAAGQISHSNAYLVLDAEGRIVHRQDGLRTGTASVLALLQSISARS